MLRYVLKVNQENLIRPPFLSFVCASNLSNLLLTSVLPDLTLYSLSVRETMLILKKRTK